MISWKIVVCRLTTIQEEQEIVSRRPLSVCSGCDMREATFPDVRAGNLHEVGV